MAMSSSQNMPETSSQSTSETSSQSQVVLTSPNTPNTFYYKAILAETRISFEPVFVKEDKVVTAVEVSGLPSRMVPAIEGEMIDVAITHIGGVQDVAFIDTSLLPGIGKLQAHIFDLFLNDGLNMINPNAIINPGEVVIAMVGKSHQHYAFYRAIIMEKVMDSYMVYLADYGNILFIPFARIYRCRDKDDKLVKDTPPFAIRASLRKGDERGTEFTKRDIWNVVAGRPIYARMLGLEEFKPNESKYLVGLDMVSQGDILSCDLMSFLNGVSKRVPAPPEHPKCVGHYWHYGSNLDDSVGMTPDELLRMFGVL